MVKGIFAEQALAAAVVERDQTRDHFVVGSGLCECDRFLEKDLARPGMNGNVGQPELFDTLLVTNAEIDAPDSAEIRSETPYEDVVFRGDGALDASSGRGSVLTDSQALGGGTLQEGVAQDHPQAALARDLSDALGQRDYFTQARSTFIARKQVFLYGFLFGFGQCGEPIVAEDCGVDGIRAAQAATPMHLRNS